MRGFTLLEVLVALAIAALVLTTLNAAALHGTRATRISAHTEEAISRAQSRLAAIALTPHPGEQSSDGDDGFSWRAQVQPVASATPHEGSSARPVLYHIWVDISWRMDGGRRHVRLDTMRLANAPQGS